MIGIEDGRPFAVHGVKAEVVDTTGAGDTFCGVLAASMAEGMAFRSAVERAVLASGLSVTKAGAQASIPTRAEVDAFAGTQAAQDAMAGIHRTDDGWIGHSPSSTPPTD